MARFTITMSSGNRDGQADNDCRIMNNNTGNQGAAQKKTEGKPAPAVVMEKISFSFSGVRIFENLNFTVPGGQWTCLLGPSGSGKSTLLRIISGSLDPVAGTVNFDGAHRKKRGTAWMAQKDLLLPWLTVEENVLLGARLRGEINQTSRSRARALIDAAGLAGYGGRYPATLSGGMRQRVALLRTLMEDRPVILMDEPFSALDALTRLKLQDLAADLVAGATVLLVTHDPLEALRLGHRIHVMTGRPATIDEAMIPVSPPPRRPDDPAIAGLYALLLDRLTGKP